MSTATILTHPRFTISPLQAFSLTLLERSNRCHLPFDSRRAANRHAPRRYIFGNHTTGGYRGTLPNGNSRQDNNMTTYPAVISNSNGLRILDVVPPALHFRLMRSCENADARPKHNAISNGDQRAIEDTEVKVCVDSIAHAGVAAVLQQKWGFNGHVFANTAEDLGVQLGSLSVQEVEVSIGVSGPFWEPGVVLVAPCSSVVAGALEGRYKRIISMCFALV